MSRLCRLKSYKNIGEDGVWAYNEITQLRHNLKVTTETKDQYAALAAERLVAIEQLRAKVDSLTAISSENYEKLNGWQSACLNAERERDELRAKVSELESKLETERAEQIAYQIETCGKIATQAARIAELERENASLSAGQCCVTTNGLSVDDGGVIYCKQHVWREQENNEQERITAEYEALVPHLRETIATQSAQIKELEESFNRVAKEKQNLNKTVIAQAEQIKLARDALSKYRITGDDDDCMKALAALDSAEQAEPVSAREKWVVIDYFLLRELAEEYKLNFNKFSAAFRKGLEEIDKAREGK